ncbi:2336_t:CDS:2, partial [Funneliformis geosporum]
WDTKLWNLWNIADGLSNIHEGGIIHRDFHSGNILMYQYNQSHSIRIGDLGLSKPATEVENSEIYGIIPYMAPEVLQGQKYTIKSDIYSFGMIMWEWMTGRRPFWDRAHDIELIIDICDGLRPQTSNINAPEGYIELMKECWDPDPSKRPARGISSRIWDICKEISLENCEILKFASFNLKELILQYNSWKSNITISMIKYLGISLQRLLVSDKTTIQIIQTISDHCLNLSTLEIKVDSTTDISIFPYLKNLNIKILNILIFINNNGMGDWFISLANSLPTSVKEISFHSITLFHSSYFKILLDNCHEYLVTINLNDYINLYNLKAVLDYAERSNHHLRLLGIRMNGKRLSDDESQLMDKIKTKGVNVMEFNSIYKETDYVFHQ